MADDNIIACGRWEYRYKGGELQRRPLEREGMSPVQAAWLVLNHGEYVPTIVRAQFIASGASLRFD